ncbi:prephenate dehydrogenase [Anaerovorax odorimutans]|uniref:Prephenate dehydrogenase n=1 Tax=Anaerovorax odorimutans TaxID=109327 RepID=A0ABT1RNU0_9FIRM|nr:prephenate dehydrogenase [Anaerovorax odorimutans]MCQ4636596.1 prephenate dehydrogenase [Anaerovorax odorimutans]
MKIAIIGLGLIGGSMAKAIKENTDHTVYGYDLSDTVQKKAKLINAIDEPLTDELLRDCDLTIVALYPQAAIDYIRDKQELFKKGSIVLDCCGVKQAVCSQAEPIALKQGFVFIGGHPMAGLEHSGFDHAEKALFKNASMILTPTKGNIQDVEKVKDLFTSIGFTNLQIATPREHDQMIAFTSQLAHVVSSAYIKSPAAMKHKGFSAGSYRDLTRVAKLNENMWTELFLDNPDFLAEEIDGIADRLKEYSRAIREKDAQTLRTLLKDGREKKAIIDGEVF